jgi:hypothetical protein
VRVGAWTGWDGNRLRKETRDAFISAYGGTPIKVKKPLSVSEQIRNKYLKKD